MRKSVLVLLLALAGALAVPQLAGAAEYKTFVGCDDLAEEPVPSHTCELGNFPGAYFESDIDTEYEVCVEFPGGEEICAEEQEAEAGILYVNSITNELEGTLVVSWYVEGAEVGFWTFSMDAPPPPAPAPVPAPAPLPAPVPPPAAVTPVVKTGPSARCRSVRRQIRKLSGKLQRTNRSQLKSKIKIKRKKQLRAQLRKARTRARRACP